MKIDGYLNDPWLMRLYRNEKEWNTIGIVIHNNYDERIMGMLGSSNLQKVGVYYGCGFDRIFEDKMHDHILTGVRSDLCELQLSREIAILKAILIQTCFVWSVMQIYSPYMVDKNRDKDLVVMIIDNTRTSLDFGGLMEILSDYDKRIHVMTTLNVSGDGNGNKIMVRIPAEVIMEYDDERCGIVSELDWEKGVEIIDKIFNNPPKKEDTESNCCNSVETINK